MSKATKILLDRSSRYLLDTSYLVDEPFQQGGSEEAMAASLDLAEIVFTQINAFLKATIDARDFETFQFLELEWAEMLDEAWRIEPNSALQQNLDQALQYRSALRLGLAMWIVKTLSTPAVTGTVALRQMLVQLQSRFSDVDDVLDSLQWSLELDNRDSTPWSWWLMEGLREREAHIIDTDGQLKRAAMILAVAVWSDKPLRSRKAFQFVWQDLSSILDGFLKDASLWSFTLPEEESAGSDDREDFVRRASSLRESLGEAEALTADENRARVRETPVDANRLDAVVTATYNQTQKNEWIRALTHHFDVAAREVERPASPPPLSTTHWLPREWFIAGATIHGMEMLSRDFAMGAVRAAEQQLAGPLNSAKPPESDQDVPSAVSAAIATWSQQGRPGEVDAIFLPLEWRVRESLGLPVWGAADLGEDDVPSPLRDRYVGLFEGIEVYELRSLSSDRAAVASMSEYVELRRWLPDSGPGIAITTEQFDSEVDASEFLETHPPGPGDDRGREQIVRELREQIQVRIEFGWELTVLNAGAALCIPIPEDLRG